MEEVHCASLIAHLEGWHRLELPGDFPELGLRSLERRVLALEVKAGIATPPPFEELTWNGVVWRLWRVRHQSTDFHHMNQPAPAGRTEENARMWKDDMSMANLRRVVDALSPDLPLLAASPAPHTKQGDKLESEMMTETDGAGDDGMGALVQKLAYMAGRSGMSFTHGPMTMAKAYAYVAELSFSGGYCFVNQRPPRLAFPPPPNNFRPVVPPPFGVPVQGNKFAQPKQKFFTAARNKSKPRPPSARDSETLRGRSSSTASDVILSTNKGSSSKFGWMRKLMFWRRNRSSSRSSRSSGSSSRSSSSSSYVD